MLDARQPQAAIPALTPDVQVRVKETRTGQFMAIGGVNTDVGLSDEVQLCPGPVVPVSPVQAIPACHGPVVPPCPVQAIPSYPMQSVLPRPVPGTCEIQITGVVLPQAAVAVPAVRSHVGTWVRVVGPVVYTIQLTADHMTITATSAIEHTDDKVVTERAVMTADYHLMRDGTTAVGLITSFDAQLDGDLPEGVNYKGFMGELSQLQKVLTDKPLALSLRMYGDALVIGNVRLPEMQGGEAWSLVTVLGGRYSPAGDKPLPKPKIARAPMLPRYPLPAAVITPVYPYGNVGTPVVVPAAGLHHATGRVPDASTVALYASRSGGTGPVHSKLSNAGGHLSDPDTIHDWCPGNLRLWWNNVPAASIFPHTGTGVPPVTPVYTCAGVPDAIASIISTFNG